MKLIFKGKDQIELEQLVNYLLNAPPNHISDADYNGKYFTIKIEGEELVQVIKNIAELKEKNKQLNAQLYTLLDKNSS